MLAFLSGWRLYVLAAVVLAFLALVGTIAFQREQHKADVAELSRQKGIAADLTEALKQEEADKALLARKAQELDAAILERDQRLKALNETKRKLADELDRLKSTVPPEDKACLDRPLPNGILDLLRDGTPDHLQDGNPEDTGSPAIPLP